MKEENQAIKEFGQAFDEFFKNKPKPKDEEENKRMLEEFFHWYNNVRKQSDTGKTPAEMYKEAYGEEAPDPTFISDEEDLDQEELEEMKKFFDKAIWPQLKKEVKEFSKKDACFHGFLAGTEFSNLMFEEEMKLAHDTFKDMTPEEIVEMIKKSKNRDINRN